eukprot:6200154-Prymnesium_polylepis.1
MAWTTCPAARCANHTLRSTRSLPRSAPRLAYPWRGGVFNHASARNGGHASNHLCACGAVS